MHRSTLVAAGAVLAAMLAGTTCKVVNDDHCANQDIPGNDFCLEFSSATPYCSPCRRDFHGCVDFEPFACPGYTDEIGDSSPPMTGSSGDPTGTGGEAMSTGAGGSSESAMTGTG